MTCPHCRQEAFSEIVCKRCGAALEQRPAEPPLIAPVPPSILPMTSPIAPTAPPVTHMVPSANKQRLALAAGILCAALGAYDLLSGLAMLRGSAASYPLYAATTLLFSLCALLLTLKLLLPVSGIDHRKALIVLAAAGVALSFSRSLAMEGGITMSALSFVVFGLVRSPQLWLLAGALMGKEKFAGIAVLATLLYSAVPWIGYIHAINFFTILDWLAPLSLSLLLSWPVFSRPVLEKQEASD